MEVKKNQIDDFNRDLITNHQMEFEFLSSKLNSRGVDVESIIRDMEELQIAIPSWALGAGGTRFGRFAQGGTPGNLQEKIKDVGLIHHLTHSAGKISLHIPWDIPENPTEIVALAKENALEFDAMNSNTFQDQEGQKLSYKLGSLSHVNSNVRQQAIDHNKKVIDYGCELGSKSLTVWLADGSNHPGQSNFRRALNNTFKSLESIYNHMPEDWSLYIEYKPFEPYFYSTVIPDWGTSFHLASSLGERAFTLVDLGHHLPNTNIEQIVSTLISAGKLGGFHFNDSKFADDDLTVGSIKPYQLFLIFNEIVQGMNDNVGGNPPIAYMIDASHNIKDPIVDLIQSLDSIGLSYIKSRIIDSKSLNDAQLKEDTVLASEIINDAFQTDVRSILREYRRRHGAPLDAVRFFEKNELRSQLIDERGRNNLTTGL
ncbi:TIM barrel protein [Membranihabitans maritimus]|uniref:TIM barrel protein n=1 Tax=Membranihabitans maritimus TaxID=2904244 RepID=UPI001F1B22AF|nr:TIM barrel protein [Membranihabitans maritimus]